MKVAVRLFHSLPVGSADIVHIHEAESTVDAILMTLSRLDTEGALENNPRSIALVAKVYPDGAHLLADPEMIGRPARVPDMEPTPCDA